MLRTHKKHPQRLYSAAGDGYFESRDYGDTWENFGKGLGPHTYLSGIAVNSADHQNIVVSAASNAGKAHFRQDAESFVYRSSSNDKKCNVVTDGIPNPKGTIISLLESNPDVRDEFYCLNNREIYCSKDSGISWEMLDIPWPKEHSLQHPWALAIRG